MKVSSTPDGSIGTSWDQEISRKKAQKLFHQVKLLKEERQIHQSNKKGTYYVDVKRRNYLTLKPLWKFHDSDKPYYQKSTPSKIIYFFI